MARYDHYNAICVCITLVVFGRWTMDLQIFFNYFVYCLKYCVCCCCPFLTLNCPLLSLFLPVLHCARTQYEYIEYFENEQEIEGE